MSAAKVARHTLPNVLLIGAMKAGTTTLYRDLLAHPDVFVPLDKEPGNLADDRVLSPAGLQEYSDLFAKGRRHAVRLDASTAYAKVPEFGGVPERAARVLGQSTRILYLVRHPVDRAISHHRHRYLVDGTADPDINREVRSRSEYLDYSRYAMQLRPWCDQFPAENVKVIVFEEYIRNRRETLTAVEQFLALPHGDLGADSENYNPTEGRPQLTAGWKRLWNSGIYRDVIRPRLPVDFRRTMRYRLLPKASTNDLPESTPATRRWIWQHVVDDVEALSAVTGVTPGWTPPA